jgi:hypothetical protein
LFLVCYFSFPAPPQATYVQDNLILVEKNPFCMLPAPFNAITILLYPLHKFCGRKYGISVAGTAADYILE